MDCEAIYRDDQTCPPLVGIAQLEKKPELSPRDRDKLQSLGVQVKRL